MSNSDQNGPQLTRKQLRELRLTGSTPVIDDTSAASGASTPPAQAPTPNPPAAPAASETPVAPNPPAASETPEEPAAAAAPAAPEEPAARPTPAAHSEHAPLTRREMREQERVRTAALAVHDDKPEADAVLPAAPVPPAEPVAPAILATTATPAAPATAASSAAAEDRPKVGAAFGIGVKDRATLDHPIPAAFDELIDTSAGSQKNASTLIFTPSPGVGSLSGPIAATGDLLVTGSYKLPEGLGSHGHARGTTDGKEADAVLIDGELAPTSSPTPIAASSAISTLKPAGEVIRPPAPDKSGKLTLTLAIVAGGLGLALAAVIAIAAFTGVFS